MRACCNGPRGPSTPQRIWWGIRPKSIRFHPGAPSVCLDRLFVAGPFKGLAAITSHVHAIGSDGLSQAASSAFLMGLDPEVYLGTLLQNAARTRYRYVPTQGQTPSAFFAQVDPTPGAPGVNQIVRLPTFPHTSFMSEVGLAGSAPGYRFMEQNNALAAFQNTLIPPSGPLPPTRRW